MPPAVRRPTWIAAAVAAALGAAIAGGSCAEAWLRYRRDTSFDQPRFPEAGEIRAAPAPVFALALLTFVLIGAAAGAILMARLPRPAPRADAPWK